MVALINFVSSLSMFFLILTLFFCFMFIVTSFFATESRRAVIKWGLISFLIAVGVMIPVRAYEYFRIVTPEEEQLIKERLARESTLRKQEQFRKRDAEIAELSKERDDLRQKAIDCEVSAECLSKKHLSQLEPICRNEIIKLTSYDYEWTSTYSFSDNMFNIKSMTDFYSNFTTMFTESIFKKYRWYDFRRDMISMEGDSLRIQNMYGVWQNYTYTCLISINESNNSAVIESAAIEPGRL